MTLSQTLQTKRLELGIVPGQVERDIKIQVEQVEWLENGEFNRFAGSIFAKGMLKTYAEYLGLNPEHTLAMYRRDYENMNIERKNLESNKSKKSKISVSRVGSRISLNLKPQTILYFLALVFLVFSIAGVAFFISNSLKAPNLQITSPIELKADYEGKFEFNQNKINLKGKVDENAILKVNNLPIFPNENLEFETGEIALTDDENEILIEALNTIGRRSFIKLIVVKKSPEIKIMNLEITPRVENQRLIIRIDGTIKYNSVPNLNERLKLNAKQTIQIQTQFVDNFIVKINDIEYDLKEGLTFENNKTSIVQK